MKTRLPRPSQRKRMPDFELTPQGHQSGLPSTPIAYAVTRRGEGYYLPSEGKFLPGQDERRHKFNLLECSLGGHVSALTLLTNFADAYCTSDEEWEALAGNRLDTILRLRAYMTGAALSA